MNQEELNFYKVLYENKETPNGIIVGDIVVYISNEILNLNEKFICIGIYENTQRIKIVCLEEKNIYNYPSYSAFHWDRFITLEKYREKRLNDLID